MSNSIPWRVRNYRAQTCQQTDISRAYRLILLNSTKKPFRVRGVMSSKSWSGLFPRCRWGFSTSLAPHRLAPQGCGTPSCQASAQTPPLHLSSGGSATSALTPRDGTNTTGGGGSLSAVRLLPQCPPSPLLQADRPRTLQLWNCFRLLLLCAQFSGLFHLFLLPPLLLTSDSRVDLLSLKAFLVQAVLHSPICPLAQPALTLFPGFGQRHQNGSRKRSSAQPSCRR